MPRRLTFVGLWAVIGLCACNPASRNEATARQPTLVHLDNWQRMKDCTAQADRLAARSGWVEGKPDPGTFGGGTNQGWQTHYSPKYERCYALVSEIVPLGNLPTFVYSLYDAFENTVLAVNTNDPRENVQHNLCTINRPGVKFGEIPEWNGKKGCEASAAWIEDRMTQ